MNRIGTVYGQGLYALAKEEGVEEAIGHQLQTLDAAFSQEPAFLKLLASANMPKQERTQILDESFRGKAHIYVLNFLKLLTEKGYIRHFSACCQAYRQQYNAEQGILEVSAVAAVALTEEQKEWLKEKLACITGKKIDLICKVDRSVLGGIRLSYDGKQVDGTVLGRLEAVGKALKNTVL